MYTSWLFRALLLLGISLAPTALAQSGSGCTPVYGSIHLLRASDGVQQGWLDKGNGPWTGTGPYPNFRTIFKQIVQPQPTEQNQGIFYYRNCGSGGPITLTCSNAVTEGGSLVDITLATQQDTTYYVNRWWPVGFIQEVPNTGLYRRDAAMSPFWDLATDGSKKLTPRLVWGDGSAVTTAQALWTVEAVTCTDSVYGQNCDTLWGDSDGGGDELSTYMTFEPVSTPAGAPSWLPPDDTSYALCG